MGHPAIRTDPAGRCPAAASHDLDLSHFLKRPPVPTQPPACQRHGNMDLVEIFGWCGMAALWAACALMAAWTGIEEQNQGLQFPNF